jgi:hypothetical protein
MVAPPPLITLEPSAFQWRTHSFAQATLVRIASKANSIY